MLNHLYYLRTHNLFIVRLLLQYINLDLYLNHFHNAIHTNNNTYIYKYMYLMYFEMKGTFPSHSYHWNAEYAAVIGRDSVHTLRSSGSGYY